MNYISLFSAAGIGDFELKSIGFNCIASLEKENKRLNIQRLNNKCINEECYLNEDINNKTTLDILTNLINKYCENKPLDLIIATPPCQGMSVANHSKKSQLSKNSLVLKSIEIINEFKPNFFIFENVRSFLKTLCIDDNEISMSIQEAILKNLKNNYNIEYKIINFKDYGSNSSRTRTLVIGVKKELNINPLNLFPKECKSKTLFEIIGNLKPLDYGEIDVKDIYHNARLFKQEMLLWIKDLKEGESAFDNKEENKKPHTIINGCIIPNTNKNGDKYKRQYWNKVAACIHTRSDNLASQNTIHPKDNRVFSIRELMLLMNIPHFFKWVDVSENELNQLSLEQKQQFLKKNDLTIRKCIGEAIPCNILKEIANNIKRDYRH